MSKRLPDIRRNALLTCIGSELSTHIATIICYGEILLEENPTQEHKNQKLLEDMLEQGKQLRSILSAALDYNQAYRFAKHFELKQFMHQLSIEMRHPLKVITHKASALTLKQHQTLLEDIKTEIRQLSDSLDLFESQDEQTLLTNNLLQHYQQYVEVVESILEKPPKTHGLSSHQIQKNKILIVDENVKNREILQLRLQRFGYRADICADPTRLLSELDSTSYDLILMAIVMQRKNGFDLLKLLKKHPQHKNIPVIVVSVLNDRDSAIYCIQLGADDYLARPYDPVLLKARIKNSLEKHMLRQRERAYLAEIAEARERSEALLRTILPEAICERMQHGETNIIERIDEASILFLDLVNFTQLSHALTLQQNADFMNTFYSKLDTLIDQHHLEKIKAIGDSYMVAGNLPVANAKHLEHMCDFALQVNSAMAALSEEFDLSVRVRMGLSIGPVIAGVIGVRKFAYDVWSETVIRASRLEHFGEAEKIHVDDAVYQRLHDTYEFEKAGLKHLKGLGEVHTFFLKRKRASD